MLTLATAGAEAAVELAALHAAAIDDPWDAAAIATLLGSPGISALAAMREGACVGFVMIRAVAEEAEILTLAVLPSARRGGLGEGLMRAAIALAAAGGAQVLFLEVAEDNAAARRLYRRLGMVEAGRRPRYYARAGGAVDARILRLDLDR